MSDFGWAASWRIARRDLRLGLRGLRLLFLCMFLGVGTLAAIGSIASGVARELKDRGQAILGGDIEIGMTQREASLGDKEMFRQLGVVSETIRMRAMAQAVSTADGAATAILSELKAVDAAYPLVGRLKLENGLYAPLDDRSVLLSRALADRLSLVAGDQMRYGPATFTVAGLIADEPDRLGEGFTLGPVALVSIDGLRRTGLIQPGSLYTSKYRILLERRFDPAAVRADLEKAREKDGWSIKDRDHAAPSAGRFIDRMGQFLSLVGLAALAIAGIGVGNGVRFYLQTKRTSIAVLKALGATSPDIGRIYQLQIGAVALAGVAAGLVAGALAPALIVAIAGDSLPLSPRLALYPQALLTSAGYGLLIAYVFTLAPLAEARRLSTTSLLRGSVEGRSGVDKRVAAGLAAGVVALAGLALLTADSPVFSAGVLGGVALTFLLLSLVGWGVGRIARKAPRARHSLLRIAVANLHRPGSQTMALVVALGLALTLFVTLAAVQTSLDAELRRVVPAKAPDQIILDIPSAGREPFLQLAKRDAARSSVNLAPVMRGTITAYAGQRVADLKELPEGAWFLRGERGVTYSAALPEGSDLVAGRWWPASYSGPPLVSLDADAAKLLGIGVGDTLTVSILGREIEARIASLRKVHWDTMGFNYIMVFPPATLRSAPHSLAATITAKDGGAGLAKAVLARFPGASVIAVSDVIAQLRTILAQMAQAILVVASVAVVSGVVVLTSAVVASRQSRLYESAILKTLGATRAQILGAQALEYAMLAAIVSLVALGLGGAAGWFVITRVFSFSWSPDWLIIGATLAGGACVTLGVALAASAPLLSARPATLLRDA